MNTNIIFQKLDCVVRNDQAYGNFKYFLMEEGRLVPTMCSKRALSEMKIGSIAFQFTLALCKV